MSVSSYFAYSHLGKRDHLVEKLQKIPGCSTYPSDREDLLILVTESVEGKAEEKMINTIEALPELSCLALIYAHNASEVAP